MENKELIIHPDDRSTDFLKPIYSNRLCNIVNFDKSQDDLKQEIAKYDTIMMMGHGTPYGLINVYNTRRDSRRVNYIIDYSYIDVLKQKKSCVYIWCNANQFVEYYNLSGLYTGMMISEVEEASCYNIKVDQKTIDESNELFSKVIGSVLESGEINVDQIKEQYNSEYNPVIKYNRERIYFRK